MSYATSTFSTVVEAGFVRRGEMVLLNGSTEPVRVLDFASGPEAGEMSLFVGDSADFSERYILDRDGLVTVVSFRPPSWQARA